MRMFNVIYKGTAQTVGASDWLAARRLGAKHLANKLGALDSDLIAVVDCELAGYRENAQPGVMWPASFQGGSFTHAEILDRTMMLANAHLDGLDLTQAEKRYTEADWAAIQRDEIDSAASIWERNERRGAVR